MKRIFIIGIFLIFSNLTFSQEKSYYYKISLEGVTDSISASSKLTELKLIFGNEPTFNDEYDIFEVTSKHSILENAMSHVLRDLNYKMILFERKELLGINHIEK